MVEIETEMTIIEIEKVVDSMVEAPSSEEDQEVEGNLEENVDSMIDSNKKVSCTLDGLKVRLFTCVPFDQYSGLPLISCKMLNR